MGLFRKIFSKNNASPSGVEVTETSDAGEFPQNIEPLNESQLSLINGWAEDVEPFLARYNERSLDAAYQAWTESLDEEPTRDEVISLMGAYLGNHLVSDHDMEWVMIRDQYGEARGVRHRSLQILVFPFDTIIKRIGTGEFGFIEAVCNTVADAIGKAVVAEKRSSSQDAN
jgi:hypothetical protein